MAWGGYGLPTVSPGPPCLTLLRPAGGIPLKWLCGRFRGGPPAGWARLAAVFYPFGHSTPYAYGYDSESRALTASLETRRKNETLLRILCFVSSFDLFVCSGHRRTAWGVQKGRRWPQATCPVGGPHLKQQ
jgi:hypothetical protein